MNVSLVHHIERDWRGQGSAVEVEGKASVRCRGHRGHVSVQQLAINQPSRNTTWRHPMSIPGMPCGAACSHHSLLPTLQRLPSAASQQYAHALSMGKGRQGLAPALAMRWHTVAHQTLSGHGLLGGMEHLPCHHRLTASPIHFQATTPEFWWVRGE